MEEKQENYQQTVLQMQVELHVCNWREAVWGVSVCVAPNGCYGGRIWEGPPNLCKLCYDKLRAGFAVRYQAE